MLTVSADVERLQRRLASGGYGMELPPNIVADLSRVARGLHRLQGVLTAAEKQPFEASRELRLRKIKQHVYDVEDILDDLEDGSIRGRKLQENSNLWSQNTKIIVTTCSENVAKLMHTNQLYKLGPLSEEHCWAVFSQRAFRGGVNSDFTRMGKQILNMCEGIPAVAHCLGSLMHDKGMGIWNDEKASLWKLERQFPFQVNMFSSIKQIYYNMPSALKSCLNHLSMFPKGSVVRMENLIRQWAALGILGSTHGSLPVYSQGKKYIHELLSVFFLEEPNQSSGYVFCSLRNCTKNPLHNLLNNKVNRIHEPKPKIWEIHLIDGYSLPFLFILVSKLCNGKST
ncbi:hypothetical protein HU200_057079 [Digitaria exilis]|uniref:Disease resistance protein winged helix domain-containing protein n=1 Tax=Digitaria exilis TaxID=1010633 RepID=A0A835ABV3_9POAL|nr:hypothetical protein HU200_057079 [Digitaria exilis]